MGNTLHGFNCCANPTTFRAERERFRAEQSDTSTESEEYETTKYEPSKRLEDVSQLRLQGKRERKNKVLRRSRYASDNLLAPVHHMTRGSETEELYIDEYLSSDSSSEIPSSDDLWEDETLLDGYLWERVFLSHSAKQRDFVEKLCIDLCRANISCFFDRSSVPVGQRFNPTHSFEAPKKCEVAIVVLSVDYINSELPMLQLCAFVQAKRSVNSRLKIYPLFYHMSPEDFFQKIDDFEEKGYPESWGNFVNVSQTSIDFISWLEALKALRSFEEPLYVPVDGRVDDYRHKFLRDVYRLISPDIKGKERLWQVVANLFEKAPYYTNGVKVIGLYGIDGSGKTTLCKSLCDFYSDDFKGKVFHAEFQKGGMPVETLKALLQILTDANEESLKFVGNYEQALSLLKQHMNGQRVFLCLDGIPDRLKSVKEAQAYLTAGFGKGSLVVLTARSVEILERIIADEEKRSFVCIPDLSDEEAIEILLNLTEVKVHNLTSEEKPIAAEYADLCRFGRGMSCRQGSYNPLALRVLGAYLCEKFGYNPSQWLRTPDFDEYAGRHDAQEFMFHIFEQTINTFDPQSIRMLLLLIFYAPSLDFVQNFRRTSFQWVADVCSCESNNSVLDAMCSMKKWGLMEMRGRNSISFHDMVVEFGKSKLERMQKWLSVEGKDELPITTPSILEVLKLKNYTSRRPLPFDLFSNVSVVHLESVWNLTTLNFESMKAVRSITVVECYALREIRGLRRLPNLRFLRVEGCESLVECPRIRRLKELRHLQLQLPRHSPREEEMDNNLYLWSDTCSNLEEIYLDGICKVDFSGHLRRIRTVSVNNMNYLAGYLKFRDCQKLQWIKLWNCQTLVGLDLTRCINLRSIYVHRNDYIKEIVGLDGLIALEELHLMEMNRLEELPRFQQLRDLKHLTLHNLPKLKNLPDLSNCNQLTKVDIDFSIGGIRIILREVSDLKETKDRSDEIAVY